MQDGTFHWSRAGVLALALGVWAAACTSASQQPQNNQGDGTAAGPATGSVGAGAATSTSSVSGGTPSSTTTAGTTTGGATAAATGAGGAASVSSTTTGTSSTTGGATDVTGATTGGTGGTTGATSTTGATDASTTTGGGTGGTGEEASCSMRPALTVPLLVDFESYDGATEAIDWGFSFNDDGSGDNVLYGGFFDASDQTGTPTLDMIGSDTSAWAVRAANTEASDWGGGIGIWLGCMDASSYTGLSLAVRGSTPNENAVDIAISVDGLTGSVRTTITVTDLFTTFELPFTDFTNEYAETTNGDNINGLSINAIMVWVQDPTTEEWNPTPGPYELVVDDIKFY